MAQNSGDSILADPHIGAEGQLFSEEDLTLPPVGGCFCCPPFCYVSMEWPFLSGISLSKRTLPPLSASCSIINDLSALQVPGRNDNSNLLCTTPPKKLHYES